MIKQTHMNCPSCETHYIIESGRNCLCSIEKINIACEKQMVENELSMAICLVRSAGFIVKMPKQKTKRLGGRR